MADTNRNDSRVSVELERLIKNYSAVSGKVTKDNPPVESKRNIDWICQISENLALSGKTVDMLVETKNDQRQLDRFVMRLDELIHEISDQYGGILSRDNLFNGITRITMMLEQGKISELMMRVAFLPQVERIEEGIYQGNNLQSVDGMVGIPPYSVTARSANKIHVVMKEDIILGY